MPRDRSQGRLARQIDTAENDTGIRWRRAKGQGYRLARPIPAPAHASDVGKCLLLDR